MTQIIINKEAFLDDLYNSSSHEEVLSKIQREKVRVEKVKDSGSYIILAQLHLLLIGEIEFYINNGVLVNHRDVNLNERVARIFNKLPI